MTLSIQLCDMNHFLQQAVAEMLVLLQRATRSNIKARFNHFHASLDVCLCQR